MVKLMQQVLEALLKNAVAPAVARSGDLDESVKTLKKAVVGFTAEQSSAPKDVLAKHFGKSDRWVYRHLEEHKREIKRGRTKNPKNDPANKSLLNQIMLFAVANYPNPMSPNQILKHLSKSGHRISLRDLSQLLLLYSNMGLLKAEFIGADGEQLAFAATSNRFSTTETVTLPERLDRLALRSRVIFPIAMSYVQGDEEARFSYTQIRLMRKHLQEAVKDCRAYMVKRFNQAVEDSLAEDPEECEESEVVEYTMLFLGGVCGFDDQK